MSAEFCFRVQYVWETVGSYGAAHKQRAQMIDTSVTPREPSDHRDWAQHLVTVLI